MCNTISSGFCLSKSFLFTLSSAVYMLIIIFKTIVSDNKYEKWNTIININRIVILCSCSSSNDNVNTSRPGNNKPIKEWESLRFGAFVHFNDNTSIETEISKNSDPAIFNRSILILTQ